MSSSSVQKKSLAARSCMMAVAKNTDLYSTIESSKISFDLFFLPFTLHFSTITPFDEAILAAKLQTRPKKKTEDTHGKSRTLERSGKGETASATTPPRIVLAAKRLTQA